jgi:hypothetical protein
LSISFDASNLYTVQVKIVTVYCLNIDFIDLILQLFGLRLYNGCNIRTVPAVYILSAVAELLYFRSGGPSGIGG